MKGNKYGCHRVISPKGLFPQAAEKLDNDPRIYSNELLIDVIALQPTATAFGNLKKHCGEDAERIGARIVEIVDEHGKFQDPETRSGGMLIGWVKQIGSEFFGDAQPDIQVGDKIATLVSLSLTPLKIYGIGSIDLDTEQVRCRADAILFETGIYTKLPDDLDEALSLALMDVAGAPAQVAVNVKVGDTVVVIGAGKAGMLCLAEAKRRVSPTGLVVCMEYSQTQCDIVSRLGLADIVIQANGQEPLAASEKFFAATGGRLANFAVSTVSVPNTELTPIIVTANEGKIYFFSMSTDFAKASLGAEGIKKYSQMLIGDGYYPGHAEIAFNIIRTNEGLRDYFQSKYCK